MNPTYTKEQLDQALLEANRAVPPPHFEGPNIVVRTLVDQPFLAWKVDHYPARIGLSTVHQKTLLQCAMASLGFSEADAIKASVELEDASGEHGPEDDWWAYIPRASEILREESAFDISKDTFAPEGTELPPPTDGDPTAEDAPEVNQAQSFEDFSSAPNLLQIGVDAMRNRAASRDNDGERSMAKTVAAFNALSGERISEEDGWLFMVCLKLARSMNGSKKIADDYADGAAYLALQGECALREQRQRREIEALMTMPETPGCSVTALKEVLAEQRPLVVRTSVEESLVAGDRVNFRRKNQEGWELGTCYDAKMGAEGPVMLRIRPDAAPTKTIALSEAVELQKLRPTSPQD